MSERKWSDGWAYEVRRDGSIYMVRGHPATGRHMQFDFYGDEPTARMMVAAEDMASALEDIADLLERVGDSRKDAWAIDAARAALRRAKGEA